MKHIKGMSPKGIALLMRKRGSRVGQDIGKNVGGLKKIKALLRLRPK